jgi:sodium pump decarboxylase gamma subunit
MSQLIQSGLTVTLIGMGTVFVLLTLLVWIVQLMSRISRRLGAPDGAELPAAAPAMPAPPNGDDEDQELIGVVGAAIRMYRSRHGRR